MLQSELSTATSKLAAHLTKEIRELGSGTNALEDKMEAATTVLENHEQDLTDRTSQTLKKSWKWSCCSWKIMRIALAKETFRGIPEAVTDFTSTATALFQELVQTILIERLEFDRINRSLGPKKSEGPPGDIIIKFTFYCTKETLLRAARERSDLQFQGH